MQARNGVLARGWRIDWRHIFLTFGGRINRKEFWLALLVLLPVGALQDFLLGFVGDSTDARGCGRRSRSPGCVLTLYPHLAVEIKRLHDFDWSGWWALPIELLSLFAYGLSPVVEFGVDIQKPLAMTVTLVLILPSLVIGFPCGTRERNRFGLPRQAP